MSKIRVLVGTKKGAFILTSDGQRRNWEVSGPHFAGWEIYHLKGSSADPKRIYASQSSGWFGQVIQRSDDGGKTWNPPGTKPEDLMSPDGMPKGQSSNFGAVEFDPQFIRQLQFNLSRTKAGIDEVENLDQEPWDIE